MQEIPYNPKPRKHFSDLIAIAQIANTTAMITPSFHLYVRSSHNIHNPKHVVMTLLHVEVNCIFVY